VLIGTVLYFVVETSLYMKMKLKKEEQRILSSSNLSKKPLSVLFFERSAEFVAQDLLGSVLVVGTDSKELKRVIINETEAYLGESDLACHASKGRTKRTEVMYGEAGTIYMYLIYGMYWMFNVVTGEKGFPSAVLIRGADTLDGPGKLTKKLGLTGELNGQKLGLPTRVWIESGYKVSKEYIVKTPRIGVGYAKEWAKKPLRFLAPSLLSKESYLENKSE
jgi:DNA-3-methyladenine glycosylase